MKFLTIFACILASILLDGAVEAFTPRTFEHRTPTNHARTDSRASVGTEIECRHETLSSNNSPITDLFQNFGRVCSCALLVASLSLAGAPSAWAARDDGGATSMANAKITTGGASTLQSGRTIAITRGVNLDMTDFSNQNLKGVAFQQSIVRDANFQNSNLVGASFFDATVDGSNFENADLSQANFEMAQFNRASLKVCY